MVSGGENKLDEANFTSLVDKVEKVEYNFYGDATKKFERNNSKICKNVNSFNPFLNQIQMQEYDAFFLFNRVLEYSTKFIDLPKPQ